jgi:hypothetical protein
MGVARAGWRVGWLVGALCFGGCVTPPPTLEDYGVFTEDTELVVDTEPVDDTEVVADGPTVLVLDDGGSAAQVVAALRAGGVVVVEGPNYAEWDGSTPPLDGVQVVLLLQGLNYNPRLGQLADVAIRDFVAAGGGLVRTERAAASADSEGAMRVDASLPVVFDDGYGDGEDWWVDDRDHELVQGLPAKWEEPGGFSEVEAIAEATVILSTRSGIPLVSLREDLPGRVVHLNHDLTATAPDLSAAFEDLLVAAARWAAN